MSLETERLCRRIYDNPNSGRMVAYFGENGSGKTTCAEAIHAWVDKFGGGKEVIKRKNKDNITSFLDVAYWRWPDLLDTLKSGGWDIVDDLYDYSVLIIDELGGGHDPTMVGVDKLCQILSRREFKWTIITTNYGPNAWQDKFDRRVASRLRAAQWIDTIGVPDYRPKIGAA